MLSKFLERTFKKYRPVLFYKQVDGKSLGERVSQAEFS